MQSAQQGVFAHDVVSSVSEKECAELSRLADGKQVLELGSLYGRSTIALASTASKVHAVDWHLGDEQAGYNRTLDHFINNLYRYQMEDLVVIHMGRFENVLPIFRPASFDLVFVDGFHGEQEVKRDFNLCLPLLREDGVVAFHDYGVAQKGFGVTEAVDLIRGLRPFHRVGNLGVLRV